MDFSKGLSGVMIIENFSIGRVRLKSGIFQCYKLGFLQRLHLDIFQGYNLGFI